MSKKIRLAILGSTGSIGTQTLDVVRENPEAFEVISLTANRNAALLLEQVKEFKPKFVALADEQQQMEAFEGLCVYGAGEQAVIDAGLLPEVDTVMMALLGFSALKPTLKAIEAGKDIALANKESLVAASSQLKAALKQSSTKLVPVDSEHNSLYQCLHARDEKVRRVMITASGGPFVNFTKEQLLEVTPEQAVKHPRWNMGAKISVDSSTLMNKGLEVIEAAVLFDLPAEQVEVLVHPQSVLHGMVEFEGGASVAVLYEPSMKVPIAHALSVLGAKTKEPLKSGNAFLDFSEARSLEFFQPDLSRFPCLKLCYDALNTGGSAPLVLNAANEVAVEAFLAKKISYAQIPKLVEQVLAQYDASSCSSIEEIFEKDLRARESAQNWVSTFGKH